MLAEVATRSIFPIWFTAVSPVIVAISPADGAWLRRKLDRASPGRFV
jgi:hypothetical protein